MGEDRKWEALNTVGFKYSQESGEQKKEVLDPRNPPAKGFVTDYAMTLAAEDKAEVFACLMIPAQNKLLSRWAKTDEILRKKIEAVKYLVNEFCGGLF